MFLARNPLLQGFDVLGLFLDELFRHGADRGIGIGVRDGVIELVTAPLTLQGHLERIQPRQVRIAGPKRGAFWCHVIGPQAERRNLHRDT